MCHRRIIHLVIWQHQVIAINRGGYEALVEHLGWIWGHRRHQLLSKLVELTRLLWLVTVLLIFSPDWSKPFMAGRVYPTLEVV